MTDNSLLIHSCCAHCTAYTVDYWRRQGYELSVLWYNPNIHPYIEHQKRLSAMYTLAKNLNFKLIVENNYEITKYFKVVNNHEEQRCRYCFVIRLQKTAEIAIKNGYSNFSSSLLISPHQKHDLLNNIGTMIAKNMDIKYLYADLRKHYSDSRHMTKPFGLYRQQYCGCIYSEWERFAGEEK
jgi:predicted adenine nucleotide alpha hydrolase (AANH) superfamily ATPase